MKRGNEIATIDCTLVTVVTNDLVPIEIALDTANKIAVTIATSVEDKKELIIKGILRAQKPKVTTVTGNTIVLTDNVFNPELAKVLQGGTIVYAKNYSYLTLVAGLIAGNYNLLVNGKYVNFTTTGNLVENDTLVYNDKTEEMILTYDSTGVSVILATTISATAEGTTLTFTPAETTSVLSYTPPVTGTIEATKVFTLCAYSAIFNEASICTGYEKIIYPNCQGEPIGMSSEDGVFRVPEYTINSAPNKGEAPYIIQYVKALPTVS